MKQYTNFLQWAFGPMLWHVIIGLAMFLAFNGALLATPGEDVWVEPWLFNSVMVFFGWIVPGIIAFKVVQSWNDYKQGKSR